MDDLRPGLQVTPAVKLLRPLGQGGMGKVWVGEHAGLKTEVVVKFMAKEAEAHADAAERFAREASVAASVKSPHVTQVFDYGTTADGVPYIVMELLEGRDLAARLEDDGPMSPARVAEMISQVAKALGKAHQVGVIHRDIKPDNIFLCDHEGGELFVKLLDFGIAKRAAALVEGSATTTGQVIGTPYYMSPEQIVGEKDIDVRSDIWSLGVVAFEALTCRRPFEGMTVGAITLAIHTKKPKITELLPGAPPALDAWFARACAQEPKDRFATAREAAQALQEAVSGAGSVRALAASGAVVDSDPGLARTLDAPPAAVELEEGKARRRPPVAVVALALVAVLGLGALAVFAASGADANRSPAAPPPPAAPLPTVASAAVAQPASPGAPPSIAPPEVSSASSASSASPSPSFGTAKPTPATMASATAKPVATPARPRVRKPNDDDIK